MLRVNVCFADGGASVSLVKMKSYSTPCCVKDRGTHLSNAQ